MRVLFTGASSFTGFWFVGRLAASGAQVVAPLRGAVDSYEGVRADRVRWLSQWAEVEPACPFGSPRFLDLVTSRPFDVLCHHAAEARDYRNPDFDVGGAVAANTLNLRDVLTAFRERGGKAVVATGSVFEADEGAGPSPRRAFSPYGLSKGLTWRVIEYWCEALGLPASKFVIANPIGPFQEPRFVSLTVRAWAKGEAAVVRTPKYVRDNIHVDLLSMAYAKFVTEAAQGGPGRRFGPCGYLETQGAFAERLSRELAPRLGFEGRIEHAAQTDFSEPLARVNTDVIDPAAYGWDEGRAWDALAGYFRQLGFAASAPAPIPAVAAPAGLEIYGAVDTLNHGYVAGWLAARPSSGPRYLRVFVDEVERGVTRADMFREDLRDKGVSDGFSGFRFPFVGGLNPYADLAVRLEDRDTGRVVSGAAMRLPRLVGGEDSMFPREREAVGVNVAWANYEGDRIRLILENFGAATRFSAPVSGNATIEVVEATPFQEPYLDAVGLPIVRIRVTARPRDPDAPVDLRFEEAGAFDDAGKLLCANLIPGRLPDYADAFGAEHMARVAGPGEAAGRFAATGFATAFRLDLLTRRHFGRSLGDCGTCLDWGSGAGRVALPLKRLLAPELALTAVDVDDFNIDFASAAFPDIAFVQAPFLPPLPFEDGAFGAIFGISVLTHLTEGAQFAWLRELRRVARDGAPVILTVHSALQMFRTSRSQPDVFAEIVSRGISDSVTDNNLGPGLSEPNYYRATFHTRAYVREHWARHFDILQIYPAGNGAAQDFVVMRAK